jgi:hypothetical protein
MDAVVGWRKLMALNIEACREAVFNELQNLLLSFDWDGINLVELNYESALRFDAPEAFTPMNQDIRQVFFKQADLIRWLYSILDRPTFGSTIRMQLQVFSVFGPNR